MAKGFRGVCGYDWKTNLHYRGKIFAAEFTPLGVSGCTVQGFLLSVPQFLSDPSLVPSLQASIYAIYSSPHVQTSYLLCFVLYRPDPKVKDWHRTKGRRDALESTSALSVRGSGWVAIPGLTWDKNVSNATSMSIHTNKYVSLHYSIYVLRICLTTVK